MYQMNSSKSLLQKICTSSKLVKVCLSTKNEVTWQEIRIPVPWGHLAGKWWGPTDKRPVLTLHGWQDNCGSMDRLIPLLNRDVGFLAIDFPGHGYSSHLPKGMYYHSTNYVILIRYLKNYFKWTKTSLLGHSLGGITSYVYTMLYPKDVDFVICLDGAKPMIRKDNNVFVAQAVDKFFRFCTYQDDSKEPPCYSLDEIKKKITVPNHKSVMYEYAEYIAKRNIRSSNIYPGKYYFSRDPRLKSGGLLNFSQEELIEFAQHMTCPIFIAKAKQGSYYEVKENFYEVLDVLKRSSSDCDFHYVEGTHHVHLNNPENVSKLISSFIQRHNIEDRSVGGIKEENVFVDEKISIQM